MIRSEQDSAWKLILDRYFKDFVDYCLPQLSQLIDWDKPWVSLDKEFQALTKDTATGKRLLDKLFKVQLKNGQEQWVLVHIEVQGKKEEEFAERMFIYESRIYDKYRQRVVGCAVLTDANRTWRPNCYEMSVLPGSSIKTEFFVIKLLDYQGKEAELEVSNNPFSDVILVQLAAIGLNGKPDEQRKRVKFALTKRLYEKGYTKERVLDLYTFIDWLIGLPKSFEVEYLNDVYALEEATKMAYITSAERFGMEKGMEKGMQLGIHEGLQKAAIVLKRFSEGASIQEIAKETGLPTAEIETLINPLKH